MANEIKQKFGSLTDITITLADRASDSNLTAGRQGTIIDNTSDKFEKVHIFVKFKCGTSFTTDKSVLFYLIRDDGSGTPYRTDGAGASDADLTLVNAGPPIITLTSLTGQATLYGDCVVANPGPKWTIAFVHNTGVNSDSTAGNHFAKFIGVNPEIQ